MSNARERGSGSEYTGSDNRKLQLPEGSGDIGIVSKLAIHAQIIESSSEESLFQKTLQRAARSKIGRAAAFGTLFIGGLLGGSQDMQANAAKAFAAATNRIETTQKSESLTTQEVFNALTTKENIPASGVAVQGYSLGKDANGNLSSITIIASDNIDSSTNWNFFRSSIQSGGAFSSWQRLGSSLEASPMALAEYNGALYLVSRSDIGTVTLPNGGLMTMELSQKSITPFSSSAGGAFLLPDGTGMRFVFSSGAFGILDFATGKLLYSDPVNVDGATPLIGPFFRNADSSTIVTPSGKNGFYDGYIKGIQDASTGKFIGEHRSLGQHVDLVVPVIGTTGIEKVIELNRLNGGVITIKPENGAGLLSYTTENLSKTIIDRTLQRGTFITFRVDKDSTGVDRLTGIYQARSSDNLTQKYLISYPLNIDPNSRSELVSYINLLDGIAAGGSNPVDGIIDRVFVNDAPGILANIIEFGLVFVPTNDDGSINKNGLVLPLTKDLLSQIKVTTPTPTPQNTATASPTSTPSRTPTPPNTATSTPTPEATPSPAVSSTRTPTSTPSRTPTLIPTQSAFRVFLPEIQRKS